MRHETKTTNSSSSQIRNSALSFARPSLGSPCSGSGSANIPGEHRKRTDGSLTTRQPLASTSITRQRLSQRSMYALSSHAAVRTKTLRSGPSYRARASSVLSAIDIAFELGAPDVLR